MFEHYRLVQAGDDTYSVTLFLNPGLEEFATEPGRKDLSDRNRLEGNVRQFVRTKFPNVKVTTAKVMLGTMLVTSVPIGGAALAETNEGTVTPTTTETTTTTPTGDTTTPTGDTTTPPAEDTTTPPAEDTTTPPAEDTTTPPAEDTTTPPAEDTTTPPAGDTTTPPAGDTTTTPPIAMTDVGGSYAKDQIAALVSAGVLTGYPDGTFRPTANMTRQEFAVALAKALDLEIDQTATTTYTDVAPWARPYVAALAEAGLVAGFSATEFGANSPVTREQMATFYVRALGFDEAATELNIAPTFTDAGRVADWAKPYVGFAQAMGFVEGIPAGNGAATFDAKANAQRQQVAILTSKFYFDYDSYVEAGLALVPTDEPETTPGTTPAPDTTTPDTTAPDTTAPDTTAPDTTTPDTTAPDTTAPDTTTTPTSPDATPADPDTTTPAPDTTGATPEPTTVPAPDATTTTPDTTTAASPDAVPNDIDRT